MSEHTATGSEFESLGLAPPILKALAAEKYSTPTPIQRQAIPIVLSGRDLVGLAQTGTGKTAAFALPILELLAANRRHAGARACRTLVLAPTRELAAQIADSFRVYGRFLGLSTTVVFGGASMSKQRQALSRGVDVLVATPGRLLDHVSQRSVTLENVEILVLDEADHMLDMGFIHDLRRISKLLPRERQSLFFSATMPPPIASLAAEFLSEPQQVAVAPQSTTAERVEQSVIHVEQSKKFDLLHALVKEDREIVRALVFTRTKHGANRLAERLDEVGIACDAIHGNRSQGQRERALDSFKKGRVRLLVATEIAARGIDVDEVSHVINFDLPNVPEQYVHRIGRTARAGADGRAISFCGPDERAYLRSIEKLMGQQVPVLGHALASRAPTAEQKANAQAPRISRGRGGQQQQRAPHGEHRKRADHRPREDHRARDDHRAREEHRPREEHRNRDDGFRREAPRKDGVRSEGQRTEAPRNGAFRKEAPRKNGPSNGSRSNGAHSNGQRANGDRQDRKGNAVWSNSAAPQRNRKPRPRV